MREYPKALYPAPISVKSVDEERTLRARWQQPLPWSPIQERVAVDNYYAAQVYPKRMKPPPVFVNSAEEEADVMASWNVAPAPGGDDLRYPRWMFHPVHGQARVASQSEELALGDGWFGSIPEMMAAGQSAPVVEPAIPSDPDAMSREQMFAVLKAAGVSARVPITNGELRAKVREVRKSTAALEPA